MFTEPFGESTSVGEAGYELVAQNEIDINHAF
jgi:hypothetical protein